MQLPNAGQAIVEPRKIRDYLLSPNHPVGQHKATYFRKLGFTRKSWGSLAEAIRQIAVAGDAVNAGRTAFGTKFRVTGRIGTAEIVTVWIILEGEEVPRFLTAYPGR